MLRPSTAIKHNFIEFRFDSFTFDSPRDTSKVPKKQVKPRRFELRLFTDLQSNARKAKARRKLTWLRVVLLCCCAAWILPAQNASSGTASADDEPVYDLGPGVTPPRVIKQVNPQYPTTRGVRAVGSVIIALVVSSKGLPKNPRVAKGLDKDLDQSAVDAVKQWRFAPAQKNGRPIAVRVSLQIQFHDM